MGNPVWLMKDTTDKFLRMNDCIELSEQKKNGGRSDGLETLSLKEVLDVLGVSRSGLYKMMLPAGDFHPRTFVYRGKRYFVKVDVERYRNLKKIEQRRGPDHDIRAAETLVKLLAEHFDELLQDAGQPRRAMELVASLSAVSHLGDLKYSEPEAYKAMFAGDASTTNVEEKNNAQGGTPEREMNDESEANSNV